MMRALYLALIFNAVFANYGFTYVTEIHGKLTCEGVKGDIKGYMYDETEVVDKLDVKRIPNCWIQNGSDCSGNFSPLLEKFLELDDVVSEYQKENVVVLLRGCKDWKTFLPKFVKDLENKLSKLSTQSIYIAWENSIAFKESTNYIKEIGAGFSHDGTIRPILIQGGSGSCQTDCGSLTSTSNESHYTAWWKNQLTGCTLDVEKNEGDNNLRHFSKTSVLFVSVSFIILMVISLAWLVFYYVQRFRYAHAKDRLARRLFNAAKKALTKIPTKPLRQGDKELDTDCPVCIDPYSCGDIVRVLPCKHVFHKTCVDPWLLEHRTCPMCKMDILKAFGYNFGHYDDTRVAEDGDRVSVGGHSSDGRGSSNEGSYSAYPFPLVTDSDIQDPFFPSPAGSPSMVQQVLHQGNAPGFSIIPLTVHSNTVIRPASTANLTQQRGSDDSSTNGEGLLVKEESHHSAEIHRPPDVMNVSSSSGGGVASAESSSTSSGDEESHRTSVSAGYRMPPKRHSLQMGEALFKRRPATAPRNKVVASADAHSRSKSVSHKPGVSPHKRPSTSSATFHYKASRKRTPKSHQQRHHYQASSDCGSLESL